MYHITFASLPSCSYYWVWNHLYRDSSCFTMGLHHAHSFLSIILIHFSLLEVNIRSSASTIIFTLPRSHLPLLLPLIIDLIHGYWLRAFLLCMRWTFQSSWATKPLGVRREWPIPDRHGLWFADPRTCSDGCRLKLFRSFPSSKTYMGFNSNLKV